MQASTIVVFQGDSRVAQELADILSGHFSCVRVAESWNELKRAIERYRADVAILDVEALPVAEVQRLHREYPGLSIVCTHRVADEEMWTTMLNAGASDMCPTCDVAGILFSAKRQGTLAHHAA
jgi:DNA-binding NtrC family response regulator